MKVSEIKALAPVADVLELSPDKRYIIVLPRHSIPEDYREYIQVLLDGLKKHRIPAVVMVAEGLPLFYEIEPGPDKEITDAAVERPAD